MRLSWNEIRVRAKAFADEWANDTYESGEAKSFYDEFFNIFGARRRGLASYEQRVKLAGAREGRIDLFWPKMLVAEHKSAGADLIRAREQALRYLTGIKNEELPRYILVCDFQTFDLLDLETGENVVFSLAMLPQHVEKFGFILGVEKRTFKDQDPVNILAAELMGKLHDALEQSGYRGHDLERFLVRLLFCLFADDTGIFEPRGIMEELIVGRTADDGADAGAWLHRLFEVLNTPENQRQSALDEDLKKFAYVNGDLFAERLPIADFDKKMRDLLIEACGFKWDAISPAIFGSLFQFVMNPVERRKEGAHYTNEKCILKVIQPLFLDELRAEFERVKGLKRDREARLRAFHEKLASLKFLDPACGCGNFLIIAYRELRKIENELIGLLYSDVFHRPGFTRVDHAFDVGSLTKVSVEQFYGIELGEFPVRIAETALWMMDHIMNVELSLRFGENYARIPLPKGGPHIVHADALEIDWNSVLPAAECSYVMGNPPFGGSKVQSEQQRAQVRRIASLGGSGGTLDYVAAWFIKAGEYAKSFGGGQRIGFVATNSITQGEQVAQLWPVLFDRYGLEIAFGHRTFAWESEARGKAHVHVVIIGLTRAEDEPKEKRLFSYDDIKGDPVESRHAALSPYLIDASRLADRHLVVREASRPHCQGAPIMRTGCQPIDDGNYIFGAEERATFLQQEPDAAPFLRPYAGGEDFIYNDFRWILALQTAQPTELRCLPFTSDRIRKVKDFRLRSTRAATRALADFPTKFNVEVIPDVAFLAVPEVSSEERHYIPIAWLEPPIIPSNKLRFIEDADLWNFGVLTSCMHMAWARIIGGRLESRYQYSLGINYNPFPWPDADDAQKEKIRALAQAVLDARAAHPGSTLADLYDPDLMPADLRRAHRDLDAAVDKLYRREPFESDRARVEHLFGLYEKLAAPLIAASRAKRGRRRLSQRTPENAHE